VRKYPRRDCLLPASPLPRNVGLPPAGTDIGRLRRLQELIGSGFDTVPPGVAAAVQLEPILVGYRLKQISFPPLRLRSCCLVVT